MFTCVFTLVLKWANQRGIRFLRYLDDWLIVAELLPLLLCHQEMLLQLFHHLGIIINWEKSDLLPYQWTLYLGMLLDTV